MPTIADLSNFCLEDDNFEEIQPKLIKHANKARSSLIIDFHNNALTKAIYSSPAFLSLLQHPNVKYIVLTVNAATSLKAIPC